MEIALTLNRWLKMQDRLNALIAERSEQATQAIEAKVSFWERARAEGIVKGRRAEYERALREYALLLDALALVRSKVGEANSDGGISRMMAEQVTRHRLIGLLNGLTKEPHPSALTASVVATIPEATGTTATSPFASRSEHIYSLRVLSDADLDALRKRRDALQRDVNAAADEMAEKNAWKLTVDLPPEVATLLGLR